MRRPPLFALLAGLLMPLAGSAETASRGLALSAGLFDLEGVERLEMGLEYRFRPLGLTFPFPGGFERRLQPLAGVAGNEDGSVWVYGALRLDLEVSRHWRLSPSLGASLYEEGDGLDLGGPVEFRSGLEITYQLTSGPRLGVAFYHLSNAGLYDRNPGVNSLLLVISLGR